ncbi:hypothetical protein HII31_05359 [Pseudocercospora fuligena]|uniref:F-box domain-containing protein n=1 Tax=Pseudocercospora fuligena TaxID=685502 RepID=A0A8H6VNL5_9PEZI|nr:hypothetical protein HII31_05359 [Pseudocercospora fuligena]
MHSISERAGGSKAIAGSTSPRTSGYPHMLIEGGDFEQWSHAIDAMLRRHSRPRLRKYRSEAAHLHKLDDLGGSGERQKKISIKAATLMFSHVHPTILSRMSDHASKEPWELWDLLPILSGPFRLMALPAELREKVFREALPELPATVFCRDALQVKSAVPPLLHTNRQIRDEAAAVYYSESEFCCDFTNHAGHRRADMPRPATAVAPMHVLMHDWTSNVLGENKNHLRHLRLSFRVSARLACADHHHIRSVPIFIKFSVDLKKQPRLEVEVVLSDLGKWEVCWLSTQKQQQVEAHVRKCNETAEKHDWKGEVIIDAITSNPGLWIFDAGDIVGKVRY